MFELIVLVVGIVTGAYATKRYQTQYNRKREIDIILETYFGEYVKIDKE